MVEFPTNPHRRVPLPNWKFGIRFGKEYVAAVSEISALKTTIPVIKHRAGGDPSTTRLTPGNPIEYAPITIKRGLTFDEEFSNWAQKVYSLGSNPGSEVSLKDFRKDIIIDVMNESGQVAMSYTVFRCWVSEYQALPDFNANGSGIAIEQIVIQNEGWRRDKSIPEPVEQILE